MDGVGSAGGGGSGGAAGSAAADDRRGPYLEEVAREFSSWLFWRDQPELEQCCGAEQEKHYQVVTAQRVVVAERDRGAPPGTAPAHQSADPQPVAHPDPTQYVYGLAPVPEPPQTSRLQPEPGGGRSRIPSPTQELLAESRQRAAAAGDCRPTGHDNAADTDSRCHLPELCQPAIAAAGRGACSNSPVNGSVSQSASSGGAESAATQFRNGVAQCYRSGVISEKASPSAAEGDPHSAVTSTAADSGVGGDVASADEASELEDDSTARQARHGGPSSASSTMGNKMGTATPEKRKSKGNKSSPFVKTIQESGRKRKATGGSVSSAEILDSPAGSSASPTAAVTPAAVPSASSPSVGSVERFPRFPQPAVGCPEPASSPSEAPGPPAGIVTDSWKQVRRLQDGESDVIAAAETNGSDDSSGTFTDPLSSSRARPSVTTTSNTATLRQLAPGDGDTATLMDECCPCDLPLDDTPVYRAAQPGLTGSVADVCESDDITAPSRDELERDDASLSVVDQLSFDGDLTRSCDPGMLTGCVAAPVVSRAAVSASVASPAAADKSRSFSQSDMAEVDPARTPGRTGFTVTKHRKVDLGGRLNQTAPSRDWAVSEQCLQGPDTDALRRASSGVFADSNVLRKVASLTHTSSGQKVVRPRYLPEKLDFKHYEKFEGQMLVNWFVSSFTEDHSRSSLGESELRTLAVQFLTHMLAAGVLHQIEDSSAPLEAVFRPDLMYYWAHSELPTSQVSTPRKLPTGVWTPFSPARTTPDPTPDAASTPNSRRASQAGSELSKDGIQDTVRRIQERITDAVPRVPPSGLPLELPVAPPTKQSPPTPAKAAPVKVAPLELSAEAVKLGELEDKLKRLEQQLEKYKTLVGLQELNRSVNKDFGSPSTTQTARTATIGTSPLTSPARPTPAASPVRASPARPLPPKPGITSPPPYIPPPPPPPPPLPSIGGAAPPPPPPPPPPLPGAGPPPPPPLPGMGPPPPPPLPGMGPPPPPPLPGIGPPPPPLPGMGPPPPPPLPGMGPPPPPPPPGGGPLPPPPPPGGPSPLPPPPPGGWNSQATGYVVGSGSERRVLRKTPVKPKVPMRPLYWTRIQIPVAVPPPPPPVPPTPAAPSLDAETETDTTSGPGEQTQPEPAKPSLLWEQLEEEAFEEEEFTDLFARQVVQRKPVKKKEVKSPKKQVKRAKLLDSKRSQNVGILISSQHLEIADVESAVFNFDTSELSLDLLEQIYEMRATDEELRSIGRHVEKNPDIPLDKPEQFLYELSQLPHFADRITCFTFQSSFQENLASIETRLDNLKTTCKMLMTSKALQRLFGLILALGNYMNGGNRTRGQADGFGLDIIGKLKDVKSKDNTTTLLHYIVRKYGQKYDPKCEALPVPSPWDVERCMQIKFDDMATELRKMGKDLKDCRRRTDTVAAASDEAHLQPFKDNMEKFLAQAEDDLVAQQKILTKCESIFEKVCEFFQCTHRKDNKKMTPKDFFAIWSPFCADFSDIWKREQFKISKETTQKMQQTQQGKIVKKRKEAGGLASRLRL